MAVISNVATLNEGETALLSCMGFADPATISWSNNGQPVENTSLTTIYEEEVIEDGRMYLQSILQLCSLNKSNAGVYTCTVSNGRAEGTASTILTVSGVSGKFLLS